jgi:hypothetical protein
MRGESFKKKFPLLRSFTWKMANETFNPRTYARIFPEPREEVDLCFPQFTSVDLSGPPTLIDAHCTEEQYNEWMNWLAKIFPNVHNQEFNNARLLNNIQ